MNAYPNFCGGAYRDQSAIVANQITRNWYPALVEAEDKAKIVLYPTPGLNLFASGPQSPGRQLYAEPQTGRVFGAMGTRTYEVLADGSTTARGAIVIDGYPASMVSNGAGGGELAICSGNVVNVLDLATNTYTASVVSGVTMIDMLDGYILGLDLATSTLRISNQFDATTWPITQQAQRSGQPDPWQALVVNGSFMLLLGSRTSDAWFNAGTTPFPFVPVDGLVIPYGIAAPFSAKKLGASVFWLSQTDQGTGIVVEAEGYTPRRVSDMALEYAISQMPRVDDAVGWTYTDRGHSFYVLKFPQAGQTWVYDTTTQLWHNRDKYDATMGSYRAWGPAFHAFAFNAHLVLDVDSGAIYRMGQQYGTDTDGSIIRRERAPRGLFSKNQRVFVNTFEAFFEPGTGLVSGQGSDPTVALSWSKDGGKTWGPERWRSIGALGDYTHRCRWARNPSGRNLVPKLIVTDPNAFNLIDAFVDVRVGAA